MTSTKLIEYIVKSYAIAKQNPEYQAPMLDYLKANIVRRYLYSCLYDEFKNNIHILSSLCDKHTHHLETQVDTDIFESIVEILFTILLEKSEWLLEKYMDTGIISEFLSALRILSSKMKNTVKYEVCLKQIEEIEYQLEHSNSTEMLRRFIAMYGNQGIFIKY